MDLSGKIIGLLPLQTGQGKNGVWKKQEYILETQTQYPKKVCFSLWGDKIDESIKEGDLVNISFDIESREYNQRWYTEVRAWKIAKQGASGNAGSYDQSGSFPPPMPPMSDEGDLPF
jgi:hypothetical protein